MKQVNTDYWRIDIPDDWIDEHEDEFVVLYSDEGCGNLQISSLLQNQTVTMDDLQHIAMEHIDAGAEPEELTLGDFEGFTLSYSTDGDYWREWYLMCDSLMLFVTYDCDVEDEGEEEDIIEAILETLQSNVD